MVVQTDVNGDSSGKQQQEQQAKDEYMNVIRPEELLAAEYDMDLENIDLGDIMRENRSKNTKKNVANQRGGIFRTFQSSKQQQQQQLQQNIDSANGRGKNLSNHRTKSRTRSISTSATSYNYYNHAPSSSNSTSDNSRHRRRELSAASSNGMVVPSTPTDTIQGEDEDEEESSSITSTNNSNTTTTLFENIINLFRRVLPSSFSSTAWWLSVHTLGLCDMILLEVDGSDTSSTVTLADTHRHDHTYIKFGLWAYSDAKFETFDDDFVMFYVNQWEQLHQKCIYPLEGTYGTTSLFVMDNTFRLSRVCALLTTSFGFICMMILWAAVVRESLFRNIREPFTWRTWVILIQFSCCIFEAMTLLVLKSRICNHSHNKDDGGAMEENDLSSSHNDYSSEDQGGWSLSTNNDYYYRNCEIDQGASIPILSCCFWFFAIIAMLTWPKDNEPQHPHTFSGFWSDLATEHFAGDYYSKGVVLSPIDDHNHPTTCSGSSSVVDGINVTKESHHVDNDEIIQSTSHHDGTHGIVTYSSQSQLQQLDDYDDDDCGNNDNTVTDAYSNGEEHHELT